MSSTNRLQYVIMNEPVTQYNNLYSRLAKKDRSALGSSKE